MGRFVLLATVAFIGLASMIDFSDAASESKTIDGKALEIRTGCVKTVEIQPRSDLVGKITVDATADRTEEIDGVTLTSGDTARIERRGDCGDNEKITLELKIGVPAGTPLEIHNSGSGDYVLGAVGGPLKAQFSGSGDIKGGTFTSIDLAISGSSDADLDHIDGPASFTIHGSGDVKIGTAKSSNMKIAVSGSGDVELGSGVLGDLDVSVAGSGDVVLHAVVETANLATAGSGDIKVDKVNGNVRQRSAGSGEIRIGG